MLEEILGLQPGTLPQARREGQAPSEPLIAGFLDHAMAGVRTVSQNSLEMISDGLADRRPPQQAAQPHHSAPELPEARIGLARLHDLIFKSETGENLKIRALNLNQPELLHEIERAGTFDQTELFQKIEKAAENGEPFGVLLGDYDFSNVSDDLAALEILSQIAAEAHAPLIAAAAPEFFGLLDFAELDDVPNLIQRIESVEYDRWRQFRSSDSSRYVGLCLPHILMRLPYGRNTHSVELFQFEEDLQQAGQGASSGGMLSSPWADA